MKKKLILISLLIVVTFLSNVFAQPSEKDMEILYKNPPAAKKSKVGYILYKPSVKKIKNKVYEFTMVQVASEATPKWNLRTDCGKKQLAYGCARMSDNNGREIKKTDSCGSGTFEQFKVPKDKDWKEVVRIFCERYNK
jgi:hypothetical protein